MKEKDVTAPRSQRSETGGPAAKAARKQLGLLEQRSGSMTDWPDDTG